MNVPRNTKSNSIIRFILILTSDTEDFGTLIKADHGSSATYLTLFYLGSAVPIKF